MVNNVLYGCDFSEKSYSEDQNIPIEVTDVRDVIKQSLSDTECMSAKPSSNKVCIISTVLLICECPLV